VYWFHCLCIIRYVLLCEWPIQPHSVCYMYVWVVPFNVYIHIMTLLISSDPEVWTLTPKYLFDTPIQLYIVMETRVTVKNVVRDYSLINYNIWETCISKYDIWRIQFTLVSIVKVLSTKLTITSRRKRILNLNQVYTDYESMTAKYSTEWLCVF